MSIIQALKGTRTECPRTDYDWVQYFHQRLNNDSPSVNLDRAKVAGLVVAHEDLLREHAELKHRLKGLEK